MHSFSKRIGHVYPLLHRVTYSFDHAAAFEDLMLQPFHTLPRISLCSYLFCYSMIIYIVILTHRYISRIYKMLLIAATVHIRQVFHQQDDEQPRAVCFLQEVLVIRQLWKIPFVMRGHNTVKGLQILHSHGEPHQVRCDYFGQGQFLLWTSFILLEVSGLLPKGSMKKSLKKIINKGKKESAFISVHIQPPGMWCWLNTFYHILRRL